MSQFDELLSHDLLDTRVDSFDFPDPEQLRLTYERARLVCQQSGVTVEDVVKLKPRFWELYRHPIFIRDSAMGTALSIHWNLCIGTIGAYARHRPDLAPLLEKLVRFNLCGEFLLTEIGRGLDARNLETTAALQPDGSFDLHTPRESAAKAMPPTSPAGGIGRVGVVFARLIVNGADHGVKPFIVNLSDESDMLPGITSRLLPRRCGAKVLDHAITTFSHVRLSAASLLGSLDRAEDQRADFFRQIHRVAIGTLSLSMTNIPALRQSALIAGTYSSRRRVTAEAEYGGIPIIQFSTQHRPILDAIVQSWAYDAFADEAITQFMNKELCMDVRHAVVVCFKTAVGTDAQVTINELAERCGWQGLFAHNEIIELAMALKGNAIAEGDYTVLCIRLVSEVLLGRYKLPEAKDGNCLLAKHEAGIWQEAREMLQSLGITNYRSEEVNAHLLPRCRDMVKASGHRMAYEAAVSSGKVKPTALRLFESTCIKSDLSWYCQFEGFTRNEFLVNDVKAVKEALPLLQEFLTQRHPSMAAVAPIMHETSWDEFFEGLPTFQPTRAVSLASSVMYRL